MDNNSKIIIHDELGHPINLKETEKIGEGGQGVVYKLKGNKMAEGNETLLIKLAKKNKNESLKYRVSIIKSLNLDDKLNFAIPLLNLDLKTDECEGYLMLLMEDMVPISKLLRTSFANEEEAKKWYKETGGLKRRIELLKKIAYNLYQLHSKGLVYCDISPNNIFISENVNYSEAWFIDCDNIDYYYNINFTIGTPGFCSPEIRKSLPPYKEKNVNTIENDIYAFANLAYMLLFLADPFKGSILERKNNEQEDDNWEDDWDDCGEEESNNQNNKEKIFDCGEVAWIGEGDKDNEPRYGFSCSMDKFITKNLFLLFERTFGKKGRNIPETRPSLRIWYEELNNLSLILNSSQCDCNYFYYDIERCKNCDKKSNLILLKINYKNLKNNKIIIKDCSKEKIEIFNGDLGIGTFDEANEKVLELSKLNKKNYLKNCTINPIKIKEQIKGKEYILKILPKRQENVMEFFGLSIELSNLIINIRRM